MTVHFAEKRDEVVTRGPRALGSCHFRATRMRMQRISADHDGRPRTPDLHRPGMGRATRPSDRRLQAGGRCSSPIVSIERVRVNRRPARPAAASLSTGIQTSTGPKRRYVGCGYTDVHMVATNGGSVEVGVPGAEEQFEPLSRTSARRLSGRRYGSRATGGSTHAAGGERRSLGGARCCGGGQAPGDS